LRSVERDLVILKETNILRLDAQDKRIADINAATTQHGNHTAAVGNYIAWTSVVITLIVFAAGLVTYFSATRRAQDEARKAAKRWFDENALDLKSQIEGLRQQASSEFEGHKKAVAVMASSAQLQMEEALKTFIRESSPGADERSSDAAASAAAVVVQEKSIALRSKPEASFSPEDHFTRGLSHFSEGRFESAIASFNDGLSMLADAVGAAPPQLAQLLSAKALTLDRLGRSEDAIAMYDELDRCFAKDVRPALREQVARGLLNKGFALDKLYRPADAIAAYAELDRRFGKDEDPALREQVARGLFNKGFRLGTLDKPADEIAMYDELDQRFGKDKSPVLREAVARGLVHKGITLSKLGRPADAIAVYDELDRRFGKDESAALRIQVAQGLFNRGNTFITLDRHADAIAAYDELDRRFGKDESRASREQVASGLFNKGAMLGTLDRYEDAITVYDELDRRFGNDESPALREQVAFGLINKGISLNKLDERVDALEVYDEIIRRFGKDASLAVRAAVTGELNRMGFSSILSAKRCWQDQPERERFLSIALSALQRATALAAEDTLAIAWGNLGYCQFLMGEKITSRTSTIKCLRAGSQASLEQQRTNAKTHRIDSVDSRYEELLTECWNELNGGTAT
jgi:tetratricopeptide (TPR) repeat protein